MPIQLTNQIIINDIGSIFIVEEARFNFAELSSVFIWKIKTDTGKILKQGTVSINKDNFVQFYNNEYTTHSELVNKVAELAGYNGQFISEVLQ